jgi:hypothetical protein
MQYAPNAVVDGLRSQNFQYVFPIAESHSQGGLARALRYPPPRTTKIRTSRNFLNLNTDLSFYSRLRRQPFKMAPSNLPACFNPTQSDIEMLLAAQAHLGSKNLQVHMEPYLWKTRPDGVNVINIGKTWEKIVLAARVIAAIDNPADSTFSLRNPRARERI